MRCRDRSAGVKKRVNRRWWALSAAAALLMVASCGGDDESGSDADEPAASAAKSPSSEVEGTGSSDPGEGEQPVDGGSLDLLYFIGTPGFDPAIGVVNTQFAATNYAVYDALAIESPADGGTHLRLLESAESGDNLTWTLKVKPDVKFSDGTPFNAEAIKFNWERLADPDTGAVGAPAARAIKSMKVVDDLTLKVVLHKPDGQFPNTIATNSLQWIGSPTAIKADPEGFNSKPVGAGPFVVKEFAPDQRIVFERNPNYFDEVHLDKLTLQPIPDETQRLATLQSNDKALMYTPSGVTATQAIDAGFDTTRVPRSGGFVLMFNMRKAPFDDLRARQAFSYALDTEEITTAIIGDAVPWVTNIFDETSPFYDESLAQPDADDAKAQALFDELADENGKPLKVTLAYVGPTTAWAEQFQTKLREFDNVEVSLEPLQSTESASRFMSGSYDFAIYSFSFIDPAYMSTFLASDGATNFAGYSNPKVDELLVEARGSQDLDKRVEIFKEIQQEILKDVPMRFITRAGSWYCFNPDKVKGISAETTFSQYGIPMFNELWLAD